MSNILGEVIDTENKDCVTPLGDNSGIHTYSDHFNARSSAGFEKTVLVRADEEFGKTEKGSVGISASLPQDICSSSFDLSQNCSGGTVYVLQMSALNATDKGAGSLSIANNPMRLVEPAGDLPTIPIADVTDWNDRLNNSATCSVIAIMKNDASMKCSSSSEINTSSMSSIGISNTEENNSLVVKKRSNLTEGMQLHSLAENAPRFGTGNVSSSKRAKIADHADKDEAFAQNVCNDDYLPIDIIAEGVSALENSGLETLEGADTLSESRLLINFNQDGRGLTRSSGDKLQNKCITYPDVDFSPLEVVSQAKVNGKEIVEKLHCSTRDNEQLNKDSTDLECQAMEYCDPSSSRESIESENLGKEWENKDDFVQVKGDPIHSVNERNVDFLDGDQRLDVISAEESLKVLSSESKEEKFLREDLTVHPSDSKEKRSLPPSPIRGLVDDFVYPNKPNNLSELVDTCKFEASFSFPSACVPLTESSSSAPEVGVSSPGVHHGIAQEQNSTPAIEDSVVIGSSCHAIEGRERKTEISIMSPQRTLPATPKKILLVLDLNGLLADIVVEFPNTHTEVKRVGGKNVCVRPFYEDFLQFCFERFNVGIWSSRRKYNLKSALDFVFRDRKDQLLFCWDQDHCTVTGFGTIDNPHKPLVFKELKKIWNKESDDLHFEKGEYTPSNTLLVDDSPYKALCNPPFTAIFPLPYSYKMQSDNSLGPGGDLRKYLEQLSLAGDVQRYVREHPFGQPAITSEHPEWKFYADVLESVRRSPAQASDPWSSSRVDFHGPNLINTFPG